MKLTTLERINLIPQINANNLLKEFFDARRELRYLLKTQKITQSQFEQMRDQLTIKFAYCEG